MNSCLSGSKGVGRGRLPHHEVYELSCLKMVQGKAVAVELDDL